MPMLGRNNVLVCQEKGRDGRDGCGQQGQSQHLSPLFQNGLFWAGSVLTWLSLSQDQVCPAAAMGEQDKAVDRREKGRGSGRAAQPWPQWSPLLALTRDGWITRPTLGECGGRPPAHTSALLSLHVAPRGASLPWRGSHFEVGESQLCWDRGFGRGWTGILATRALNQQERRCFTGTVLVSVPYSTSRDPLGSKEGLLFPLSAESPEHPVPQQH